MHHTDDIQQEINRLKNKFIKVMLFLLGIIIGFMIGAQILKYV